MPLYFAYLGLLLLSAIIGIVYWESLKSRMLHLFVPLLLLSFVIEVYCYYAMRTWNASTGWIYNLFLPAEVIFFSLFYYRLPLIKRLRGIILVMLITFCIAEITVFGILQSIQVFNTYLFLAGAFLIVSCGVLFLYEYFQLDNSSMEKHWLPVVWVTAGLVIFFSVSSITIALYRSLVSYQIKIFGIRLHQVIPQFLSILWYGCFAYAFYLCRKKI
jgi:hypothetical protein